MGNRLTLIFIIGGVLALLLGGLLKWWMISLQEDSDVIAAGTGPVVSASRKEQQEIKPISALPKPRRQVKRGKVDERFREQFARIGKLLQNRQVDQAVALLQEILKKDPKNERALEEMGMIYMTEYQDPSKALSYFQKVVDVNPNNEFAVMELVGISTHPSRSGQTLEYLRNLYDKHPGSAILADGIGELLLSQGRLYEALPYLEKSAEDPKYAEFAHSRMAAVYQQMGDMGRAIGSYRKAISRQQQELQKRQSGGMYSEMVELDLARSRLDLARLLMTERKYDEAEALIDRARVRLGNDWEIDSLYEQLRTLEDASQ